MAGGPPDAFAVDRENTAQALGLWPGRGVLLFCAAVLVAGYGVVILRGPAPAGEVRVMVVPAPEGPVAP